MCREDSEKNIEKIVITHTKCNHNTYKMNHNNLLRCQISITYISIDFP